MFITKIFIISFSLIVVGLYAQESRDYRMKMYSFNKSIIFYDLQTDNQIKGIHNQRHKYFSQVKKISVNDFLSINSETKYSVQSPDSIISKNVLENGNNSSEVNDFQKSKRTHQTNKSETLEYSFQPEYNPLFRFGKDLWMQATSPFRMKGNDFLWFGAGTLITAGLLTTDQASYNYIQKGTKRTKVFRNTSPEITEFGANYGLLSLGAFAGYSFLFNDKKAQETSFLALESFLTSSVWIVGIKWIAGRQRPSAQVESQSVAGGKWYGPVAYFRTNPKKSITNFDAFPSGHTATAFSIATVIAKQYDQTLFVPILSYTAATIVGITRIGESTHWASDVFVGAIIGYLSATQVVHNNPSEYTREKKSKNSYLSKFKTRFSLGMYENAPSIIFNAAF